MKRQKKKISMSLVGSQGYLDFPGGFIIMRRDSKLVRKEDDFFCPNKLKITQFYNIAYNGAAAKGTLQIWNERLHRITEL